MAEKLHLVMSVDIQTKDQRMELEELVVKTKNITKSDGKFFVKSMIECMAKIKFDKRIKVTYEKKIPE